MSTPNYCTRCGAVINPGAAFCPSCGAAAVLPVTPAPVVPPTPPTPQPHPVHVAPTSPPPAEKRSGLVIGAVISLVVIAAIFWLALSGFPIRKRENRPAVAERSRAVVEEGEAGEMPEGTATIRDLEQPPPLVPVEVAPATTTTAAPSPAPIPIETTVPPRAAENPPPAVTPTPSASPDIALQQRGEISEARAVDRLTEFLRSTNFYKKPADCIALRSDGYRNVGYDLQAFSTCEGGGPELLDRWRVDAKTEEVFRRRSNGRYLAP